MPAPEIFAVTGQPVGHSLSPEIFRLLFREFGLDAVYTRLAADSAREALGVARAIGVRGLNVTSPFKEEMMALVDGADEHAAAIGAANCLVLSGPEAVAQSESEAGPKMPVKAGGRATQNVGHELDAGAKSRPVNENDPSPQTSTFAYNTDFIGLIGTLYSQGIDPAGRTALVLGTGGAARAAAYGLVRAKAGRVFLASRSLDRGQTAARSLGCEAALLDDAAKMLGEVDICVSCLPFPASRILPQPAPDGVVIVDAHYATSPDSHCEGAKRPKQSHKSLITMRLLRSQGSLATTPTGGVSQCASAALLWLFHQAIPSFEIFTGLKVSKPVEQKTWEDFLARRSHPRPHVAFVGFMGAGKTTTGRELARLSGREFVDTDALIEAAAGMGVSEIFKRLGEKTFRALEKSAIETLASSDARPKVIAVGGGAVLDEDNRAALAENCRIVWLWAPARTALARVDVATRPVLDPRAPLESAERTLAARVPRYASVADLIVNAEGASPLDIAGRIKDEMGQAL